MYQIEITTAGLSTPTYWQHGKPYHGRRHAGHYAHRLRPLYGHRAVRVIPYVPEHNQALKELA